MTAGTASPRRLPAPVLALRAVVAVPELRRLLGAWLAFNAAEWATWVAILVFAYFATGPASVGLVALAQLVPAAIAAPFTARLGDRVPRHRALTLAYLVVGLAMLAAGAAMFLELPVDLCAGGRRRRVVYEHPPDPERDPAVGRWPR